MTASDPALLEATTPLDSREVARRALLESAPADQVGEHQRVAAEDQFTETHVFDCTHPGYLGWQWSVTVTRASGETASTVNEVVLLPGAEAIVAPGWVPYKERLQPGDLSPGDLLPVEDDDPRLVPTYLVGEDDGQHDSLHDARVDEDRALVKRVAAELGLGRVRTLSREGLDLAAQRWYDGDAGPDSPLAKAAPQHCWSCGFLLRIAGSLADSFGVCANGNANDDGRAVSLDHGCGAHSEVKLARKQQPLPVPDHAHDTFAEELEEF